jgi:hypothetical protein
MDWLDWLHQPNKMYQHIQLRLRRMMLHLFRIIRLLAVLFSVKLYN